MEGLIVCQRANHTNYFWWKPALTALCFLAAVGTSPASIYATEVARPDLRGALITAGPLIGAAGKLARTRAQHTSRALNPRRQHYTIKSTDRQLMQWVIKMSGAVATRATLNRRGPARPMSCTGTSVDLDMENRGKQYSAG